jgi:hypothetical protein
MPLVLQVTIDRDPYRATTNILVSTVLLQFDAGIPWVRITRGPKGNAVTGGAVHRNHGIEFTTKRSGATLVVMRWNASKIVQTNAVEYEFQRLWGDLGNWYSFLHTEDSSDEGTQIGARLPGGNDSYCLRMIAIGSSGEYVGSGTSGNRGPCI